VRVQGARGTPELTGESARGLRAYDKLLKPLGVSNARIGEEVLGVRHPEEVVYYDELIGENS
jgi:hypothetical protein